jgi:hypothetical protein
VNKQMKKVLFSVLAVLFTFALISPAMAGTSTATATVSATVPAVTLVSLTRDSGSVSRGTATQIVFDRLDSQDNQGTSGNAGYMYAPYRSETGKNWHIANVTANGATMVLSMAVTGTAGTTPLSSILSVFCGGFWTPGATNELGGTKSTDWEFANGWQRSLSQPFTGTVPFNYRLTVTGLSAGTYNGSITLTLTTT